MLPSIHRPAYVEVDLSKLKKNLQNELNAVPEGTEVFAVVKANAYGHGLVKVAQAEIAYGATGLCVATLDEALEVRNSGVQAPILVLGIIPVEYAKIASRANISVTVGDLDWLKVAVELRTTNLKVHLAIDSGMGRIGFQNRDDLVEACNFLNEHQRAFIPEGLFTHFATADSPDEKYFEKQVANFKEMKRDLPTNFTYVHCANSATALWHKDLAINMVRYGIALYGLNPSGTDITQLPFKLEPALSLYSELVFVKKVKAGTSIGYGATYTSQEDEWIGTVPIGYSDGWLRRMSGSNVLINGQKCQIVGRVCMDQFMVRLPKKMPVGTRVTIIGKDGDEEITATDVAEYAKTINYEILCCLSERLPRVYKK
ncbi:alanine racemase [Companilactobacillus halodurans]|uniref:Alanine racemase n=1 Tax=Companilactobacillus halodurans TaxID=2584183 RepID=A0A5P0ZUW7_9LACO|nr:alanine racemase [Companilactobacillus halodurans]MQS76136.1 alanine racemase [Companilactobacillus halodurans]MQS96705.1 alanine racemase [Companilactobacillus halodurans]